MRRWCLILTLVFGGCDENILHELSERDANAVIVALENSGIDASKQFDAKGWVIKVAHDDARNAMATIKRARVLRAETPKRDNRSFVQTKEERQRAIAEDVAVQLESTLESIPHVIEARVHLNLQTNSTMFFGSMPNHSSASVLLVVEPETDVERGAVQRIVAGGAGMPEDAVSVVVSHESKVAERAIPSKKSILDQPMLPIGSAILGLLLMMLLWQRRSRLTLQPRGRS